MNVVGGILGSLMGESTAVQKARLHDASEGAKDLTNLIKKRKLVAEKRPHDTHSDLNTDSGEKGEEVCGSASSGKRVRITNGDAE